jgi:hypothetical protein
MSKSLTDEQWNKVQEKYGKLITFAASRIYFDKYCYGLEDSIQELKAMLLKGIVRFCEIENTTFDIVWEEPGFHRYAKTIIWNSKNTIGMRIRKSSETVGGVLVPRDSRLSIKSKNKETEEIFTVDYPEWINDKLQFIPKDSFLNGIEFDPKEQQLIELVLGDLGFFKPNNKVHVTKIAKELNTTSYEVNKLITSIKNKLQDIYYET